jgi:hypothetical protein
MSRIAYVDDNPPRAISCTLREFYLIHPSIAA